MRFSLPFFLLAIFFAISACQSNPYRQGERLYQAHCGGCHMEDGSGLAKLIPPLDSSALTLGDPEMLICLIRQGLPVNPHTQQQMPANTFLNDVELTNLVNFLGSKYASNPQTIRVPDVKKLLATCQTN